MAEKKLSLYMKIMIGVIPVLLCGLVCMFIFAKKNKGNTTQNQTIMLADSKVENAPTSKVEAYKADKEKQDEKQRLTQESKIMSNSAFYNVEDGDTPPQHQQAPEAVVPATSNVQVHNSARQKVSVQHTEVSRLASSPKKSKQQAPINDDEEMSDIDRLYKQQRAAGIKTPNRPQKKTVQEPAQVQPVTVEKVKVNPNGRSRNINTSSQSLSKNLISAVIHNDQVVTSGAKVKIRLCESIVVDGVTVPRNSFISGLATFSKTRMNIVLQSIVVGNNILPFNKSVYDKDGMEGIYLPDNTKSEAASEAGSDLANGTLNTITGSMGIVGAALNSGKSLVRKATQRQTVTLKSNYKIFIK